MSLCLVASRDASGADAVNSGEATASALNGESRTVRFVVAHLFNNLSIPQEERDRARNMLEHGRSLDEVVETTKLSSYLVRRLRQEVMAAQIQKRNRRQPGISIHNFHGGDRLT
jgi:hypothetical protein